MTDLLAKLFIKDYKNPDDPIVRKKYGTLSSIVGMIVNFLLAGFKLAAGLFSSSLAIIADAVNNFSDAGSSAITLISFQISSKPADKDHPFGHARMEYISSMIVSFLILLVGVELFLDSGKTLLGISEGEKTTVEAATIIILSVSILGKLWLGLFYSNIGKKINSGTLKASATDSLSDCISTTAVLISSVIIKLTGFTLLDSIVGIAVSILILIAGGKILIETKNAILGEGPVDETVEGIKKIISSYPEIIGVHDMLVHNYGPKNYIASLHAEVDGKGDIFHLHDVIDNVERQIKTEMGILCTIHMDPIVTDDEEINELKLFLADTMSELGIDLHIHDFRTVVGTTHTNLIFDIVAPFEYRLSEKELIKKISEAVVEKRENCYCVITVDRE